MQINLELYRVFYMAAKWGSLTRAAKELYISQPAVSQSIKQLESQLGGKLFVRTNKGMKLTYEGKIIYEYIKQANNLIDLAEKKFVELQALDIGEITIGASDTIIKHYLIKYIKAFNAKYPNVNIRITNRTSAESIGLLKERKVDIAFINLPFDDAHGLTLKPCCKINDTMFCSKQYAKRITAPLQPKDLMDYPMIVLERLSNSRVVLDDALAKYDVVLSPALQLGSVDMIVEIAKIGMGIGVCGREYILDELNQGSLVEVPMGFNLPERALGLATNQDVPLSFSANQFVNMLFKG